MVVSEGLIYVLDSKDKKISVFESNGVLLHKWGESGYGPGELNRPVSIAVDGESVYIVERSGRTSVFDINGTFSHSFLGVGIMHLNSNVATIGDSLVVIGGMREKAGDRFGGTMSHIYSKQGVLVSDFFPLSELAEKFNADLMIGGYCDSDLTGHIWCVQPMDYTIKSFDQSGSITGSLKVEADGFRPIISRMPENARSKETINWIMSWDKIMGIYSISESFLLTQIWSGSELTKQLHLVDKKTGEVIYSGAFQGRIGDVNPQTGEIFIVLPAKEEPFVELTILSLNDILGYKGIASHD